MFYYLSVANYRNDQTVDCGYFLMTKKYYSLNILNRSEDQELKNDQIQCGNEN